MDILKLLGLVGVPLAGAVILGLLAVLFVYSLAMQRRAVHTQQDGMDRVAESLDMQRESLELARRMIQAAEESLALQQEQRRLLARIADRQDSRNADVTEH